MPKYPEHLLAGLDDEGRLTVTCTKCNLTVRRFDWIISDSTWKGFLDSFLADHASSRHRKIEGNSLHKEGRK